MGITNSNPWGGEGGDSGEESVGVTVARRVAEREGVDERDLPESLYDALGPELTEALFDSTGGRDGLDGRLDFRYCGYSVMVHEDGTVTVVDPERR